MIENWKDSTLFRLISYVANAKTGECLANALKAVPVVVRPPPAVGEKGQWGEVG
jgi:hypothetical protein